MKISTTFAAVFENLSYLELSYLGENYKNQV